MPTTRNSSNNPMATVQREIRPCFVHFRETVIVRRGWWIALALSRLLPIPSAERRHHLNFRCPLKQSKKKIRMEEEERRLVHVTRGGAQRHQRRQQRPRHRWLMEDAQSQQPLPRPLNRRSHGGGGWEQEEGEDGENLSADEETSKEGEWRPRVAWKRNALGR